MLREIGDLALEQLATLRHRGALGTVALTFVACCKLANAIEKPNDRFEETMLVSWYNV